MTEPWRISVLGGLRAECEAYAVTRFRTQKTGWLLAYLAYHFQRVHLREELADRFWPDADPEAGRTNLRTALSSLRRQLEPPGTPAGAVLMADRVNVRLNPEAVTVDAAQFEAALRSAAAHSEDSRRITALLQAVEHYGGELLPGCGEEWVLMERERLGQAYLGALRQLVRLLERTGDLSRALDTAHRAVAASPLDEECHQDLMRLLAANGQADAAMRQFEELGRLLRQEMDETPSAATRALVERIRREPSSPRTSLSVAASLAPAPDLRRLMAGYPNRAPRPLPPLATEPIPPRRLPLQFTRFFGRETEIAALGELLRAPETRLVTLTGPGGSGKTRLAIEIAGRLGDTFGASIYFASLAELAEARHISDAVLGALGLERLPGVEPLAQIVRFLEEGRALLMLDNIEHLVEEGAPLVHELLARAPRLTCLVTSRQTLEIAAEREFVVPPLPVPESARGAAMTPERLMEVASVQLFTDRARAALPDFAVTPGNAASVAALCARLEGIPLAIELAAARASMLTPAQMLSQLDASLDFLVSRRRDIPPRHRTLRAAILWSLEQLSSKLQRFFASLSVFRGGWTLDAAESVCQEPAAPERVVDRLTELRACSLILAIQQGSHDGTRSPGCPGGVMRYRMLETLREFAAEQVSPDEAFRLRRRHADWCVALMEEAIHHLRGPEQGPWLDRLEAEHDNFRAALAWLLEANGEMALRLATMLSPFWEVRGHVREGRKWLESALARGAEPGVSRARALDRAGALAGYETEYARARALLEESLTLFRRLGHPEITAPLTHLSGLLMFHGDLAGARLLLEEALAVTDSSGDPVQRPGVLENLSRVALLERDYPAAERFANECLALAREVGDPDSAMGSLMTLGLSALNQSDHDRARRLFQELFAEAQALGDVGWQSGAAWALGLVALFEGDYGAARSRQAQSLAILGESAYNYVKIYILEAAAYAILAEAQDPHDARRGARLLGAVAQMKQMGKFSLALQVHRDLEPLTMRARLALGEREFEAAYASGATLTLEEALREAFASDGPPEGSGRPRARGT